MNQDGPPNIVLVDCLTLLANNVLITLPEGATEAAATAALMEEVDELLAAWQAMRGQMDRGIQRSGAWHRARLSTRSSLP